MKHLFFTIVSILFALSLQAQNMSVKSFKYLEKDMDARVTYPVKDVNGDVCAIIKVVTSETGFSYETGLLGIIKRERKTGEDWLYVPWGLKALTIKHAKLGILRNYAFPLPIEKASVYEMVLTTAKIKTIIEEPVIENQWLTINTQPEGATVFLNGEMQAEFTPFFKKVKTGEYTYRIELAKYHNTAGKIEVTADKKAQVDLKLKPAFGNIKVTSTPETGATVVLDGNSTGKTTPCTLEEVKSGSHQLRLMKSMYKPVQQNITVNDGETTDVTIELQPNFATVNISTKPEAAILVDGQQKGTGTWNGRLDAGVHSFEARKDKHKKATKTMELAAGDKQDFTLSPTPRNGLADIVSNPMGATITINGKKHGTTPNTVRDLLIGAYTLKLEKDGYGTITKTITIKEDQTITINETLPSGVEITLTSDPAGAELYIDGASVGKTPYTATLGFGNHEVKLINGKKTLEETISVAQGGKTRWNFDVIEFPPSGTFTDKRDNQTYKYVTIGNQVWMTENMNYDTRRGSWCYDDNSRNCNQYGRLYNWETAKRACPSGWHLPTKQEFEILLKDYRNKKRAYKTLISGGSSGFSALLGGYRDSYGKFGYLGFFGTFWSSSEYTSDYAWYLTIASHSRRAYMYYTYVSWGFSVRCLQD